MKNQSDKAFISNENVYNHHFGLQLCGVITMSQATILAQAPGVQLPAGRQGRTVRTAAGYVPDALGFQGLDQPRLVTVPRARVKDTSYQASVQRQPIFDRQKIYITLTVKP